MATDANFARPFFADNNKNVLFVLAQAGSVKIKDEWSKRQP